MRTAQLKQPPPKRADGPRRAPFVALVAGLLGAGLAALLTLNTAAAAAEVQGRQLTAASGNTQDQVTQLKIDIAAKQAPGVLASEAAALGMVPDPNPVFLSIAPNGSATVLGSPVKVPGVSVPTPVPTPTATPAASPSPTGTSPTPSGTAAVPTPTPTPTPIVTATLPGGVR
jgi:hypothetical protein